MSMTPLQAIAATKFVSGEGLSPHIMTGLINSYELQVSPIRSAVFGFINSLPAEEKESAYGPLLNAWPAGIGWTTPAGLKTWATELFPPVDCEKPETEDTEYVKGSPDPIPGQETPEKNILPKETEPRGGYGELPYGYSEIYTPESVNANVSVDVEGETGTGTVDTGTINSEYEKVTGKFDEIKTTVKSGFERTNQNQFLTNYNLDRAFSGFKMHELPYQDKLQYEGLPFAEAALNYCNYVLCSGDPGRFAIVVDKVSAYVSTTGDVLDVIEKAKSMKFSDFGPNVANYSDVINMGIDKLAKDLKEKIGNIPSPPSLPKTDAKVVGTAIAAQGNVAGDPNSENAGTVTGMIEQLVKQNELQLLVQIAEAFASGPGIVYSSWVPSNGEFTQDEQLKITITTPATEASVLAKYQELDARAESFISSADSSTQLKGYYIKSYLEKSKARGTQGTIASWNKNARSTILAVFQKVPAADQYKDQVMVESKLEEAIKLLPKDVMQEVTSRLGAKVDVAKLESNTDVLDIAKVANAQPAPMTLDTAPTAIKSLLTKALESAIPGGFTIPKATVLGQNLGGIGMNLIKGATDLNQLGKQALQLADNISAGVSGIITNLKTSAKALKDKFSEIKGFPSLGEMKKIGGILKSVETSLPSPSSFLNPVVDQATGAAKAMVPEALNSIKEVMPASVESEFKTAITATLGGLPIIGSGLGGKYKVTDFLGSTVGMNGQMDLWKNLIDNVANTGIMVPGEGATLQDFVDALEAAANTETGKKATEAYNKIIEQFNKEWALLKKAKVDFVNLPCGDIVSSINLSKKLAQYAQKLDNGVAELFNSAADPNTVGGQALLSVMVEARNLKTMHEAGMNPANVIESKGDKVEPSEEDRAEAAKLQAESGDPDTITPEQVARNRALNQSLTKALVPRLPF